MAMGVRPLIEERVERRMREAERKAGDKPTITVVATTEGLESRGDTPRPIPMIPYRMVNMSRIEAMDLVQW